MKFKEFIKAVFRVHSEVIKGELEEILTLKPTDEDYTQAKQLANIAIAAMAATGIPYSVLCRSVIEKTFAYGIRDVKEGIKDNKKLILGRVIEEIRKEKNEQEEKNTTTLD